MIAADRATTPRREMLCKTLIYGIFTLFILLWHLPLPLYGDDAYLLPLVGVRSIPEHFTTLYNTNGKIFTDFLAFLFYHLPYPVWKLFNTGMFLAIAILFVKLFTKNTPVHVLWVCMLIACFPLRYLGTAGYIATCANYLYPLAGILFIALQLKQLCRGKVHPLLQLACFPVTVYVLNQDQAACVLLGGVLLFLVYVWFERPEERYLERWIAGYFVFALICYVVLFTLPGHINRMKDPLEMELYLPEYKDWNLFKKLLCGFTSTVANLFFHHVPITVLFFFLLFLSCTEKTVLWQRIVAAVPLVLVLVLSLLDDGLFLFYRNEMPDLKAFPDPGGIVALAISCICLACTVVTIWCRFRWHRRWYLLGLLLLGGGSRVMMGLSPTVYASQHRTFTYLLFCLLGCCVLLLREVEKLEKKPLLLTGYAVVICTLLKQL